jgi:hypothetical protein
MLYLYHKQLDISSEEELLSFFFNFRRRTMANRPARLSPKHWKALELIEEGSLSLKEIAKSVGWSDRTLYELYEGNTEKTGSTGDLFNAELRKIHVRNTAKVKHLSKENKKLTLIKLNEYLRKIQTEKLSGPLVDKLAKILNTLAKSTPKVEIGSFSYTRGLTAEDLINEFKRLKAVARNTLDGKGVPGSGEAGPGELYRTLERGDQVQEE